MCGRTHSGSSRTFDLGSCTRGRTSRGLGGTSFPGRLLSDLRLATGIRRRGDRREFGWNRRLRGGWGECRVSALALLRVEFT
jgi:hypothetical protein